MAKLALAGILGGIGSIIMIIPVFALSGAVSALPGGAISGLILVLIAVRFISDDLGDKTIFRDMVNASVALVLMVVVALIIVYSGYSLFSLGGAGFGFYIGAAFVALGLIIVSTYFVNRAFGKIAAGTGINWFRRSGQGLFYGSLGMIGGLMLVSVSFGLVLGSGGLWLPLEMIGVPLGSIGLIYAVIGILFQVGAFFRLGGQLQSFQQAVGQMGSPTVMGGSAGTRSCQYCGTQIAPGVTFCPKCGAKQTT